MTLICIYYANYIVTYTSNIYYANYIVTSDFNNTARQYKASSLSNYK